MLYLKTCMKGTLPSQPCRIIKTDHRIQSLRFEFKRLNTIFRVSVFVQSGDLGHFSSPNCRQIFRARNWNSHVYSG